MVTETSPERTAHTRMLVGRCYCGAVRYRVEDAFLYASNCHCSNCRRTTGSAFKPFAGIEREKLEITEGDGSLLVVGDDDLNDSHCAGCGSLLFSVVRDGAYVHVALGSLVDAPSIRPTTHIFVGSKAPWFEITDDLPRFEEHATPVDPQAALARIRTKPSDRSSVSCETRTRMAEGEPYVVHPIGVVRSTLRMRADAPNQAFEGAPDAVLEIDPAFADGLHRVQPGDELILLTWLHLADRNVLQTHPTGNPNIPLTGVFRTRSPDRPNPIGVHRVTVTAREGLTTLHVAALEAIDGTPIIDLKVAMRESPEA